MVSSFRHIAEPVAKEVVTTVAEKVGRKVGQEAGQRVANKTAKQASITVKQASIKGKQALKATQNLDSPASDVTKRISDGPSDADSIAKRFGDTLDESDNAKNIQNLNDAIHPSRELTEVDHLKADIENATSDKKRGMFGKVLGGFGDEAAEIPKAGYAQASPYSEIKLRDTGKAITSVHHAVGLNDLMTAIMSHPSWKTWHDGPNPLVAALKEQGYDFGNSLKNLTDVTDTMKTAFEQAEIDEAFRQIDELGGWADKKTLNDARGASKLEPRDLTKAETANFELARQQEGFQGMNVEEYMDTHKSPVTKGKYKEGTYPNIRIFDEEGNVVKTLQIKTAADHKRRYHAIFDAYEELYPDRNWDNVRKKFKIGNRGIDKNAALYGPDHKTIHNLIDYEIKTDPNTAFGYLEQIKNDPVAMSSIPNEQMAGYLIAAARELEAVTYNVNLNRYNRMIELWNEVSKESFEAQPKAVQQAFFVQNITEIARKGGVMGNTLTKEQALMPVGDVPEGFRTIFGWDPQVATMEATARDIAGKNY